MVKIKQTNNSIAGEDVEQPELSNTIDGNGKMVNYFEKVHILTNLNT